MHDRIVGLEVEYNVIHVAQDGGRQLAPGAAAELAINLAQQHLHPNPGTNRYFWPNGGKLYHDVGHLEWAGPECRSPLEAVRFDRVGEYFLARIAELCSGQLASRNYPGSLFIAKNNADPYGHTFGCHENYLVTRQTRLLPNPDEFFHYLAYHLVPFLVSRTILCGSGWAQPDGFRISQRAPFINAVTDPDTRAERPIVNTRDEPHSDSARYRRLHLILGDANMCEWATFLKLGTTSLVLEMIEESYFEDGPCLADPVSALHAISEDPELKVEVPLRSGSCATALEIQQWYLDAACEFFTATTDDDTARLLECWKEALAKLSENPRLLFGKLDWVTKLQTLQEWIGEEGSWADPYVQELNLKYHSVCPRTSIFYTLKERGLVDQLVSEDIARDETHPPRFTRARLRGEAVKRGQSAIGWDEIASLRDASRVKLLDPFDWCTGTAWQQMGWDIATLRSWLREGMAASNSAVRLDALKAWAQWNPDDTEVVLPILANDPDPQVRAAAVMALGRRGGSRIIEALRAALSDVALVVRLRAQEALERLEAA